MRLTKDGKPDKRFKQSPKKIEVEPRPDVPENTVFGIDESKFEVKQPEDPNVLLNNFLEKNNLELDFDVVSGTIPTKQGIIKLEKPTLTLKAKYVERQ